MTLRVHVLLLFLFLVGSMNSQNIEDIGYKKKYKNFEIAWVPYVNYSEVLGTGVGILPMVSYRISKKDTISPESTGGTVAMYTTNKSFSVFGFNKMFFNENKWRVYLSFGFGDVNFQTFFEQEPFPVDFYDYSTDVKFLQLGFERNIYKGLYAGFGYLYLYQFTEFDDIDLQNENRSHAIQIRTLYDHRDNIYFPEKGFLSKMQWNASPAWLFNEDTLNKFKIAHNHYHKISSNKILAWRFTAKFGIGDVNFNQQVVIGNTDLRGYTEGKYRGDGVFAGQAELRWNFHKRMRAVGFAGLATLYGSQTEEFDWKAYPGIGAGMRFAVFKQSDLNVGFDAALGKDDWGLYFRIAEAF